MSPVLVNPYRFGGAAPSGSYSDAVLADSPLVYYRLGEASGTTMVDSSGNSHDGTYDTGVTLGTTGLLTGDTDTAATASTSSSKGVGEVANASWMNLGSTMTAEAVFKCTSLGIREIFAHDDAGTGSNDSAWRIRINSGKIEFLLWHPSLTVLVGATTIVANTTYHVAVTYDGANMKVYLNGTQDATSAQTGAVTNSTRRIAVGRLGGGSEQFVGVIDEAAFYGSALSSARIAAHAALV